MSERQLAAMSSDDDLSTMTIQQLQELRTEVKTSATSICIQLENWDSGTLPEHMLTEEWRKRAMGARFWIGKRLGKIRGEITRRQLEQQRFKETAEQKAARLKDVDLAFVNAAAKYLSPEEFHEIWNLARECFPECFVK